MSKFKLPILLIVLPLFLLTGCLKESFFNEDGGVIRFRCDSIALRSAGYTQDGQTAILSMGVYAAYTTGDWTGLDPLNFMQDRKVERTDPSSGWGYSPESFWPSNGKVSFFAYAPYNAAGLVKSGTEGVPQIEFTVAADHAQQVDLLTAIALKNQTKTTAAGGYASFMLRHALSRISFAAKTSVLFPAPIKITSVELKNLYGKGSSSMDASNRQWSPLADATAVYTLSSSAGGGLEDIQLTDDYQTITASDGYLFLLPQTLTEAVQLVVSYTNNGIPSPPITLPLSDALAQWQPGEALRFLINLRINDPFDVELSYIFVPWEDHSTDVDINKDPFLYVTDVATSSYDAAITRIYFYTNEPNDLVFIDPIGRVSSLSGPTFKVETEFHALTKDDPDGSDNFFYDETTHQGWIDLINRNTTSTGPKQPLILKLCAGALNRYITVQPVVTTEAASMNTTRYIGTFHRHNQMGERIVTWHLSSDITWTATIENTVGDHAELVIDRMASPDFRDNLLYSLVPRQGEGAKVEPNVSVSGKGRVYFRVGWKSLSPTANRYARIKVEYSGTGAPATDYIYCRQGETTDYLLPNTTADDFTVYNLAGDGVFVDYPTQGGLLSQWGRPRLWSLVGENPPAGYPTQGNTEDIDPDVNICPERYTYLDADAINAVKAILDMGKLQSRWGYYADGFFDRRSITSHRVDDASADVASAGMVLSVLDNLHSFFVPTVGYRDENGWLKYAGTRGGYWTGYQEAAGSLNAMAIQVFDGFTSADIKGYDKRNAFFLRCIRIQDAVVISFDANGGDNAPRSLSSKPNTPVHIPKQRPDGYWKDNYNFEGWTESKDGSGTVYLPESQFSVGTKDQTLYAKWVPDLYKVNFKTIFSEVDQAKYLTTNSYSGYTQTSNGTKLAAQTYFGATEIVKAANDEKAYGHLEFNKELKKETWTIAYDYCKNLEGGTQGWRLPRVVELLLISNLTTKDVTNAIFNNQFLWSGTENTTSTHAYYVHFSIIAERQVKSGSQSFRCVRELNP